MNDAAQVHARPEAAAMADARRCISCAMTALAAAAHHRPDLGQQLGVLHAQLADQLQDLQHIEVAP